MIRLFWAYPVWVFFIHCWLPLCLVGHFVIPVLIYIGNRQLVWRWRPYSEVYKQHYNGFPNWAYIWSNEGDGVLGSPDYLYEKYKLNWSLFRIAWTWSAVRNPVNNLRFVKPFKLDIIPQWVRWIGSLGDFENEEADAIIAGWYDYKSKDFWCFTWQQGTFKAGFLWQYKALFSDRRVKLQAGWKIYPKDMNGFTIPYRQFGAGNAIISWKYI